MAYAKVGKDNVEYVREIIETKLNHYINDYKGTCIKCGKTLEKIIETGETCQSPGVNVVGTIMTQNKEETEWGIILETYGLRPFADRSIVRVDPFKSKYECKTCKGRKHLGEICSYCLGTKFERGKEENGYCRDCTVGQRGAVTGETLGYVPCPDCKGVGGIIDIPDETKKRPLTGTIIAVGRKCEELKVGMKVLFTQYTGIEFNILDVPLRMIIERDMLSEFKILRSDIDSLDVTEQKATELTASGMDSEGQKFGPGNL